MPLDPARVADTRAWLGIELTAAPPFSADVVFHSQQAAEKALKGFLAWHDIPFRKTHDLGEIGRQCVEVDASLEALLVRAVRLTEYAWKFRYPGDPDEPTRDEAVQALALSREVVDAILTRLPPEVRP